MMTITKGINQNAFIVPKRKLLFNQLMKLFRGFIIIFKNTNHWSIDQTRMRWGHELKTSPRVVFWGLKKRRDFGFESWNLIFYTPILGHRPTPADGKRSKQAESPSLQHLYNLYMKTRQRGPRASDAAAWRDCQRASTQQATFLRLRLVHCWHPVTVACSWVMIPVWRPTTVHSNRFLFCGPNNLTIAIKWLVWNIF